MAPVLWTAWRFLDGTIGPATSAKRRRELLQSRRLSTPVWFWSLVAGGLAMVAMFMLNTHACSALHHTNSLPGLGELSALPLLSGVAFAITGCAVAALVEEAAFRGYMQTDLDDRLPWFVSVPLVAVTFAVFHLYGRSLDDWRAGVPDWILISLIFSALVKFSGSIWPAVLCHFAIDLCIITLDWYDEQFDTFRTAEILPGLRIGCLIAILTALASLLAFARLFLLTKSQRPLIKS
jgi:membrane protease YdiL (CAAX protease family)